MTPPTNGAAPSADVGVHIVPHSWSVKKAHYLVPRPPLIWIDDKPFPAPKDNATTAHGYHVIATDAAMDVTDPASILLNEYFYLPRVDETWSPHYEHMYRSMVHALLSAGDPGRQRVIIVSFGMAAHAPPPPIAYDYFMKLGAGEELQRWENSRAPGERSADYYIESPACYALVGYSSLSYGRAIESYSDEIRAKDMAGIDLEATLHNPIAAPREDRTVDEPEPVD